MKKYHDCGQQLWMEPRNRDGQWVQVYVTHTANQGHVVASVEITRCPGCGQRITAVRVFNSMAELPLPSPES